MRRGELGLGDEVTEHLPHRCLAIADGRQKIIQLIADPELSGGPCRVVDILLNGALVEDQFSQHVFGNTLAGNVLPKVVNSQGSVEARPSKRDLQDSRHRIGASALAALH